MTQRVFDIENEKDMQDLWSILPDDVDKIEKYPDGVIDPFAGFCSPSINVPCRSVIKINWHDKTEITRPIQEATEQDIGKLCAFWNIEKLYFGELCHIEDTDTGKYYEMSAPIAGNISFFHCRRLTKQEIEELC